MQTYLHFLEAIYYIITLEKNLWIYLIVQLCLANSLNLKLSFKNTIFQYKKETTNKFMSQPFVTIYLNHINQ